MQNHHFRSVVVATDLSESSDEIIRTAASAADRAGAEIHVVHVYEPYLITYPGEIAGIVSRQQRIRELEEQLERQIERSLPAGAQVASSQVLVGAAATSIGERAREVDADLLVLGPHRTRAIADGWLGGTADRVLRTSHLPCLIVRPVLPLPLQRVMVPIDVSEPALGALRLALSWSAALGSPVMEDGVPATELRVTHVIVREYGPDDPSMDEVAPELHREVQEVLESPGSTEVVQIHEEVITGYGPEEEILNRARLCNADLLVVATHARGAFVRSLTGSVSSTLARRAPCSVLLVPPELWQLRTEEADETQSLPAQ